MRFVVAICASLLAALAFGLAGVEANADDQKAQLGRVMWSAFQCSMFAAKSGDSSETERLFTAGLKAGREFIDALTKGQIPDDVLQKRVPIGVIMELSGPTADFMIGRIYSAASHDAHDAIVKRDAQGLPLKETDWIMDETLQKGRAGIEYLRANCTLIR